MSPLSMFTMTSNFASCPYFFRTIIEKTSSTMPARMSLSIPFSRTICENDSTISAFIPFSSNKHTVLRASAYQGGAPGPSRTSAKATCTGSFAGARTHCHSSRRRPRSALRPAQGALRPSHADLDPAPHMLRVLPCMLQRPLDAWRRHFQPICARNDLRAVDDTGQVPG